MENHPSPEEILAIEQQFRNESPQSGPAPIRQLKILPLAPEKTTARRITEKPPPMNFIARLRGNGFIKKGIVGAFIAQGGTGKSFWLMTLASILAGGGKWGDIESVGENRTLMLCAEDDEEILAHRIWAINQDTSPEGLYIASSMGLAGPLIDKMGRPTESVQWVKETIDAHKGLDVLILDPKSRFFSGDENSNDDNTRFIQVLENIAAEKKCTILFSHHAGKTITDKGLVAAMSRGGSSLIDGSRLCLAAAELTDKESDAFNVPYGMYIKVKIVKTNYTDPSSEIYYRRCEGGALEPVDLVADQMEGMMEYFISMLNEKPGAVTRREIERSKGEGRRIRDELKKNFPHISGRADIGKMIDICHAKNMIYSSKNSKGGYALFAR